MTATEFEDTLRQYLRREPFEPFAVDLLDGRVIEVDQPTIAFDGGGALFLTADGFEQFVCEEVRTFRPTGQQASP
jgi:hypothetical protein